MHVALNPGKRRALPDTPLGACLRQIEAHKAGICAKVGHPLRVIKRQFGDVKSRYPGLMKNAAQVVTLFALANLYMAQHRLLTSTR